MRAFSHPTPPPPSPPTVSIPRTLSDKPSPFPPSSKAAAASLSSLFTATHALGSLHRRRFTRTRVRRARSQTTARRNDWPLDRTMNTTEMTRFMDPAGITALNKEVRAAACGHPRLRLPRQTVLGSD